MKATQKDFASLAPKAASSARVFFFCGPDEAGAADAAARIVSLLPDPGERIEFSGAELRRDPVRLGDEARSTSLFGGTRHIWIRAAGDDAHDAVANLIEGDVDPCPVLIVATGASDKSRTAKLLAVRPDALVAMFHPPDLGSVTASVRNQAGAAGLRLTSELAERIARGAGLDTRLVRSEIGKLALYCDASPGSPRTVTQDDLDAIGAQTSDDDFAPIVDAVMGGKRERLGPELARMRAMQISPVGLLLAIERRVAQLAALSARMGPGQNLAQFLDAEANARRIFWRDKAVLGDQLRAWRGPRLERLVQRILTLHQTMLGNSADSELLLAQELATIARLAGSELARKR
ncbi:DNA polymerase III subunit delta [Novosphingobium sp. 9U]|uniref:DNA polymerase III subunit delta n=1 Tax=Novosphingobium sp. 9U TaxID=2653158 RepID=UPI0012F36342|nr:DNA polymerase III subunit delta [Novosphingobium sp. 9U]VWX53846.1 DNA polymerase III subunit delta [Novosphingobium sp. 9U]